MPAIIELTAHPAQPRESGGFGVVFHLDGRAPAIAPRQVEVRTTADALAALDQYKVEAAATGLPLAVCMRLKTGRAPNGFRAATERPFYHGVNIVPSASPTLAPPLSERNPPVDWSGHPDPLDPDNFWIDDDTGERVDARTGKRTKS